MDYYEEYKVLMAYEEVLGAMTPPPSKIKESVSGQQEQEEIEELKKTNELFETLYILSLFVWLIMNGMLTVVIRYSFPGFVEKGVVAMAWLFYAAYCYYGYFKFRSAEKKHKR